MEKGVCNLVQKYTPEAVRERALSTPEASFQIVVSYCRGPDWPLDVLPMSEL